MQSWIFFTRQAQHGYFWEERQKELSSPHVFFRSSLFYEQAILVNWSGRRDTPVGTVRAENPFLRLLPQKLVGAVPAERERLERQSTASILRRSRPK